MWGLNAEVEGNKKWEKNPEVDVVCWRPTFVEHKRIMNWIPLFSLDNHANLLTRYPIPYPLTQSIWLAEDCAYMCLHA